MGPEQKKAASKFLSDGVLIEGSGSVRLGQWYVFPRNVNGEMKRS